jgi:glycine/D-amino acid oxidase-like deaminating enzyme
MAEIVKPDPFWWEAAPRGETESVALPETADVVIVGAGYTGLSAALTLARAGRDVVVLEKDRPGEGASSRNGGIASGNLKLGFGGMVKAYGLERAKQIHAEGVEARLDLARFIEAEKIDCDWKLIGRFTGAMRAKHYDTLGRETDLMNKHLDLGVEMVQKSEQHKEVGSDLYFGGQVRHDIGGLHPAKFHQGILDRAREAGVAVFGRTPVSGITRNGEEHVVATENGSVRARNVIVATNGYTGPATPWLRKRVVPIPSQIIATEPIPKETMDRLMPKRRMLGETRNLYHYFRPSPDGTGIVFGGRAGALTEDHMKKLDHLSRNLIEIFPELDGIGFTHSWWGYTGFTFDFLPKLVVKNGVHYAAGFCGSGVIWARWLGAKAAQDIIGNAPAETAFRADDFSTRPLYYGRPWFLPFMVGWYEFKDRMGW